MDNIEVLLENAYKAKFDFQHCEDEIINEVIIELSTALLNNASALLKANALDVAKQDANNPKTDRLLLNQQRIEQIANSLKKVAVLPNPCYHVITENILPNGLQLKKISVPLGVVACIYESRPNVTFDIAALCLKSKNVCVLKGSSEAHETNVVALQIMQQVLQKFQLNKNIITLLPPQRETVNSLFTATKYIDVIIPRGSNSLIQFVRQNSLVPVIETGAGVCHVYVHADADIAKATAIAVNAKVSRPSVCNSIDAILVDRSIAKTFLETLATEFEKFKVEIFGDDESCQLLNNYPYLQKAANEDFGREFLSLKCAIKIVNNVEEAVAHINEYGTKHSESIVSENKNAQQYFINRVDAAVVYTNASTRFTDGEEFGLGAEVGISTQKLHARGPFAMEKLVTEKWIVTGDGQVR